MSNKPYDKNQDKKPKHSDEDKFNPDGTPKSGFEGSREAKSEE